MASPQTTPPVESPWMTVQEAAKYSRKHTQTLYAALRDYVQSKGKRGLRGAQPTERAQWRIRRADVDAWLAGDDPKRRTPTT